MLFYLHLGFPFNELFVEVHVSAICLVDFFFGGASYSVAVVVDRAEDGEDDDEPEAHRVP